MVETAPSRKRLRKQVLSAIILSCIIFAITALVILIRRQNSIGEIYFVDIASASGINFIPEDRAEGDFRLIEAMGSGVGLIDFDNDGRLDIIFGQGGRLPGDQQAGDQQAGDQQASGPSCRLFHNQGSDTFVDVTQRSGITFDGFVQGFAAGDYDGDGHQDLFIAGFDRSALYRNLGDGRFEETTDIAGVAGKGWASSCAFADLNGNGYLDLYVVRYLADTISPSGRPTVQCPTNQPGTPSPYGYCPPVAHEPEADIIYQNNGDGTFTDISESSGVATARAPGLGLVIVDLDGDGKLDIYVANDMKPNQLWRNLGDLRFEEVGMLSGVAVGENGESRAGMGIAAGDYDGDGLIDLVVTNFQDEPNDVYRQVTPGQFLISTPDVGLTVPSLTVLGFGIGFLDTNNRGMLDLFVSNGHLNDYRVIGKPYEQKPQLFSNLAKSGHSNAGQVSFEDISSTSGNYFGELWLGRSAALGDLNNDGLTDIVVTHLGRPPAILKNASQPKGRFLCLRLESDTPSSSAIGSQIAVHTSTGVFRRAVFGGGSYLSTSDPRASIGLGDAVVIDHVEVTWPNGEKQVIENLDLDSFYRIRQGANPVKLDSV